MTQGNLKASGRTDDTRVYKREYEFMCSSSVVSIKK
jgi:hypothetical protein